MPVDSLLQDSIINQVSYQERSIDSVGSLQAETPLVQKAHGEANGPVEEAVDLLPGSQDPAPGTRKGLCRTSSRPSVCCVLTCGLYPTCQRVIPFPCLVAETVTAAEPEKADLQADGVVRRQPESVGLLLSDSFRYPDVCIDGKKVVVPSSENRVPSKVPIGTGWSSNMRALSSNSVYSLDELSDDCECDSSTDVDALIARKLLVLYTQHQIDQLAACASDSAFLSQTTAICQLIANIQQQHDLPEQEAECFVVQGILRLSTRGRKESHTRTELDSGRDTMLETLHSTDNDHEVKISEQTPADRMARQMRPDDRQAHSSGLPSSPIPNSPCRTDTDSSGVPLLRAFVRT